MYLVSLERYWIENLPGFICLIAQTLTKTMTEKGELSPKLLPNNKNDDTMVPTLLYCFFCHDSHNPLCLDHFCYHHAILHLPFMIMMVLLTVSPTLVLLLIHSLLLSIFSWWSIHRPSP